MKAELFVNWKEHGLSEADLYRAWLHPEAIGETMNIFLAKA